MKVVTKLADYAVAICCFLAVQRKDGLLSAGEISSAVRINLPTVTKLLKILASARVLVTKQGSKGGYMLAANPVDIALATILHAVDGNVEVIACVSNDCGVSCLAKNKWQVINDEVTALFAKYSLSDMLDLNEGNCK